MRLFWSVLAPGLLVLAACSSSPVLLDEDDVDDVTIVEQNTRSSIAPGWTWCDEMSPNLYMSEPIQGTWFEIDGGPSVGVTILDRSGRGQSADELVDDITAQADQCVLSAETIGYGRSIERIAGLDDGATGWRTQDPDGVWGEYVVVPLDDDRVLAYGFTTDRDEPPVDLAELGDLAREGAGRFPEAEG